MALNNTKGDIVVSDVTINLKGFLDDSEISQKALTDTRERVRLMGIDLLMFASGDLLSENRIREFEKIDLARGAGIYNYAQAITHRLMTSRGTHPEDRFFGVPWFNYLGRIYVNPSTILSSLTQDITDEVFKDSRTQDVIYVTPSFLNVNTIRVEMSLLPVGVTDNQLQLGLSIRNA